MRYPNSILQIFNHFFFLLKLKRLNMVFKKYKMYKHLYSILFLFDKDIVQCSVRLLKWKDEVLFFEKSKLVFALFLVEAETNFFTWT